VRVNQTAGASLIYHFEDCVLDIERRELRRGGVVQSLEPQVFDLLEYLIQNRERVVSRDDVFGTIWHGRVVSDSVLSTRINAVRHAIGDNGTQQRLIRTFRRKGIRFVGTVREATRISEVPASAIITRQRFLTLQDAPAIVVIPFANIGGGLKDEYFADGLTEEFIAELSKLDWFHVISGHSSFGYKGKTIDLKEVSHKLGVQYVLQGSVRQVGSHARIVLRLVDGASDHHLWAERFDRDLADTLGVQQELAERVVSIIGHQIFAAEDIRTKLKSPESLGVWQCIVRALSLMDTREKQHIRAAHVLLRRAIEIDPKSSIAYSLMSFISTLGVHLGWHSRKAILPIAFHTAEKALALNADEPWGHVALGYATLQIRNQPEEAIENLEHGLKLDQNLATAHYLIALASAYSGNCEIAFRHADMSEHLTSRDLLARGYSGAHDNVRATTCFVAGRYHEGINFARKALIQNPMLIPAHRQLVTNGSFAGETEQATAALKTINRFAPGVNRFIRGSSTIWSRGDDYKKYVEAFRIAGLK
jgi:TolB-like protein